MAQYFRIGLLFSVKSWFNILIINWLKDRKYCEIQNNNIYRSDKAFILTL